METNYVLNGEIRKAFIAKFNGYWEVTGVSEDSLRYYTKESDRYIYWGVKYSYYEDKLVIDWASVWHPPYPYTSFDRPIGDAIISMNL